MFQAVECKQLTVKDGRTKVVVQLKILKPLLKSLKLRLDGVAACNFSSLLGADEESDDDVTADDVSLEEDGTILPAARSSLMYNAWNQSVATWSTVYTVSQKKEDTKLMAVTLSFLNRFSKFVH